ncbi:MAG: transposase, partial [Leptolyngbyaceae bacterium]|nr:transposase [Leptolyngbyaceae bacterium]
MLSIGLQRRNRQATLTLSKMMTIVIAFHQQRYRTFKDFYTKHVTPYWRGAFPRLLSYPRFVHWMPDLLLPRCAFHHCLGRCTGIGFIDATCLKVCHNRRIAQHKIFDSLAARGKTSVDWFFGFKLHLVVNEHGELLNVTLT